MLITSLESLSVIMIWLEVGCKSRDAVDISDPWHLVTTIRLLTIMKFELDIAKFIHILF